MRGGILATLLLLALCAPAVLADNYRIDIDPIDNSIFPDEPAEFRLSITNFDRGILRLQAYSLNPEWVIRVDPALTPVESESVREHTLLVRPKSTVGFGTEGVTVSVKNLATGVIRQERLIVDVRDPNKAGGEYAPSVNLEVALPPAVNPREPLPVTLNYRNRNALNIEELGVELSSDLFYKEYTTSLGALKEKTEEHLFELEPHQAAGDYELRVKLNYRGETINEVVRNLRIAAIDDVKEEAVDESGLFRTTTRLTLTNEGNTVAEHEARLPTGWFRSLFSSTEPKAARESVGGERYHVWRLSLAPEEQVTISRTEDYRLPAILLLLAIIGVAAYYLTRSPVVAVKEAIAQREEGEEGANSLKIRLFIRNRSGQTLSGVSAIDKVPSIASYAPDERLGTVSPTKVVGSKKGTILKWELDLLEPYEERILSYNLASKLRIVGKVRLPSAKIQFTTRGGKERVLFTKNVSYEE